METEKSKHLDGIYVYLQPNSSRRFFLRPGLDACSSPVMEPAGVLPAEKEMPTIPPSDF
jgi:hypothetical protein